MGTANMFLKDSAIEDNVLICMHCQSSWSRLYIIRSRLPDNHTFFEFSFSYL